MSFCGGMQPAPEAASRGPPEPYIIDGQRFYNVEQAAHIVEGVSRATLWHWAKKGSVAHFGLALDVRQEPIANHPNGEPVRHRLLIPEQKVFALREVLQSAGRSWAIRSLDPYVDKNGKRWYGPAAAAKHLDFATTAAALAQWAERGKTPFGLIVESIHVPRPMYSPEARTLRPRPDRPVISEGSIIALRDVLQEVFCLKRRPYGGYTKNEIAALEAAARRIRSPQSCHCENPLI
jgi:hypothetical protein